MKHITLTLLGLFISICGFTQTLSVSQNGRYIATNQGKPFLWLGCTAWELFHKLDREEATYYLTTRAKQGFTVIQAVVLAENDGLRTPNAYNQVPLIDLSPEKPNEKYFEHVDFIINKANELGLVVGVLPTWGDKLFSLHPAAGPIVFNKENAEKFGEFLGKRYKDKNIVWILGGDRNVDNLEVLEIWRAMAKGLEKGDAGKHLISFHPRGESSSSYWLHNEDWLDFNIYQSGHARHFNQVYDYAEDNYLKNPAKPFVDGEPAYEDIPVKFWESCDWSKIRRAPDSVLDEAGLIKDKSHFKEGFFTDYDVRVHAYWNFLAGACGYTYGNNAVWQMFKKGGSIAIPCLTDWRDAITRPGANQIIFLKKMFDTRSIATLVPDQSIIYGYNANDSTHIQSAKSVDNTSLLVYLAMGQQVDIVMKKIADTDIVGHWYNPRTGETTLIGDFKNSNIQRFTPPTAGRNNDWLLILDSKKAKLKLP